MGPSSALRPCGHQPPQSMPCSRATSRAARSTPVCPPETILINMVRPVPFPSRKEKAAMKILPTLLVLLAGSVAPAQTKDKKPDPVLAPVEDDPKLPRVLLIGDSISMGYTLPVRELLKGKANVHRIGENGGPTTNGLKNLAQSLGNVQWDVIHFNWGLHDIKIDKAGKHQVPIEEYEKNLTTLVERMKKTGAKLIWASTTPVPEGKLSPLRKPGDEVKYNAVAKKIMEANGVAIDDLHAFAQPRLKELQTPANVHFTTAGSQELAKEVAKAIEAALKK